MTCAEISRFLDAYVDGELDPAHHLEIEAHIHGCAECARKVESRRAARTLLHAALPRAAAPAALTEKLRAALPRPAEPTARPAPRPAAYPWWQYGSLAAALAVAGWIGGTQWTARQNAAQRVAAAAVDDHVRSLLADHLMDVASTDQHTVKPWFLGKIDFAPPVVDLASEGFPLVGGRLDRIDGRPAAALVFHRHKHVINLLIWPTANTALPEDATREGFQLRGWKSGELSFLAVSDIPPDDLANFVALFQSHTRAGEKEK